MNKGIKEYEIGDINEKWGKEKGQDVYFF